MEPYLRAAGSFLWLCCKKQRDHTPNFEGASNGSNVEAGSNASNATTIIPLCRFAERYSPIGLQATASFSAATGSAQSRGLDCLKRNPWKRAWCTLVISAKQFGDLKSISFQSKSGGTKQVWAPARHFRWLCWPSLVLPVLRDLHELATNYCDLRRTSKFQNSTSSKSKPYDASWKNSKGVSVSHGVSNVSILRCHNDLCDVASSSGSTVRSRLSPVIFFHLCHYRHWKYSRYSSYQDIAKHSKTKISGFPWSPGSEKTYLEAPVVSTRPDWGQDNARTSVEASSKCEDGS